MLTFCHKKWRMVVFDEDQALKNAPTKHCKSARINADFRLALLWTPIKNKLEGLWILFNSINKKRSWFWKIKAPFGLVDSDSLKNIAKTGASFRFAPCEKFYSGRISPRAQVDYY